MSHMIQPTEMAPDFVAEAYYHGDKVTVKLSDYLNQWVVLFFYAGDFTFV
ncbi:selenocysteine-containing peroxiredoxin PrxU [Peptococcaceae bacterium CEB3]|nr:selenocysteine-containing peroxiredoxin PrxU [Peptococcaceae bacterium CEB3]